MASRSSQVHPAPAPMQRQGSFRRHKHHQRKRLAGSRNSHLHSVDLYADHLAAEKAAGRRANAADLKRPPIHPTPGKTKMRHHVHAAPAAKARQKQREQDRAEQKQREAQKQAAAAEEEAMEQAMEHDVDLADVDDKSKIKRPPVSVLKEPVQYSSATGMCPLMTSKPDRELKGVAAVAVRELPLSPAQVSTLYRAFRTVDIDDTGKISHHEFLRMVDALDTEYMRVLMDRMVFSLVDANHDEQLDFEEFVLACCMICTLSSGEVLHIIFNIFDGDGSGCLSESEVKKLAKLMDQNAKDLFPGNFKDLLGVFDKNQDGMLTLDEFIDINHTFPMMFYPAFRVQGALHRLSFGAGKWSSLTAKYDKRKKSEGWDDNWEMEHPSYHDHITAYCQWARERKTAA